MKKKDSEYSVDKLVFKDELANLLDPRNLGSVHTEN